MTYRKWLTTEHYRQALLTARHPHELDFAFILWVSNYV